MTGDFRLEASWDGFRLEAEARWSASDAAIFGASGSGKSTILEAIAGLRPDVRGRVSLLGRPICHLPARARGIGWVPQDAALFPHLTVRGNLDFAVHVRGKGASAARAIDALEIGHLLERRASALSGGERQRVAIARALCSSPSFLLLDEPLASIDRPLRMRILPFLERLRDDLKIPYLFVSHDPTEVLLLASEVMVVEEGHVVAQGEAHALIASAPAFGATAALGAENVLDVAGVVRSVGAAIARTAAGLELQLALAPGFKDPARIAIRAEDVLLAVEEPKGLSAQNILQGVLSAVDASPGGAWLVTVDVLGQPIHARVTRGALDRLSLVVGGDAWIVIKAHSIHVVG